MALHGEVLEHGEARAPSSGRVLEHGEACCMERRASSIGRVLEHGEARARAPASPLSTALVRANRPRSPVWPPPPPGHLSMVRSLEESHPRTGATASTSSTKTMHGAHARAWRFDQMVK